MARPNLWIKVFAPGIGDLVVILPILKNLKENYVDQLNMVVFNKAQYDLLRRFQYTDITLVMNDMKDVEPRDCIPHGDFYIDIAETQMEKDYWWGSEKFVKDLGHMHIYEVMEKCIQIGGDYERIESLRYNPLEKDGKRTLLLGIGGRRGNKLWFNDSWLRVYELLTERGYYVGMVGAREHNGSDQLSQLEKLGIPFFETKNLGHCIDVISNSAGMITIDSGLMHISAMQGIPTVAMFGPMPSWLWGPKAGHVVNLDGGCGINCTETPLDWECVGRPCMASFKPEDVVNRFLALRESIE
jgi:ADP-heptose:LPS heptosyltransferase